MTTPSATLAQFAAQLRFEDIPTPVVRKTEDLLIDWFGSVVAGHGARPVEAITRFALATGPEHGPSEVVNARRGSSPYLAAMANAAASHVAEQDDVHNGSVFHPATVVFSPAVAVAQAIGASGQQLTPGDDHVVVPRVTDDDRPDRHPVWRCRVIDRGREGSRRRRSIGARRRRDRR